MSAQSSIAFHRQRPIRSNAKSDRDIVLELYRAAVAAADPFRVTTSLLEQLQPPPPGQRVWLFAIGKAAHGMAAAVATWLSAFGQEVRGGLVVSTHPPAQRLPGVDYAVGDHPIPGSRSADAAEKLGRVVAEVPPLAQVYVMISGGTSSLIGAPVKGITDSQYRATFETLLDSGMDITAMNTVRRKYSRWANGRLAAAVRYASIQPIILSDVLTDDPKTIGSGPCHPDKSHEIAHVAPAVIAQHDLPVRAAIAAATERGLPVQPGPELRGEARDCGAALAHHLVTLSASLSAPTVIVSGGETTVTLSTPHGVGGRCQELALSAAEELGRARHANITLLAAGTDGRDGPTDAAGSIVDAESWGSLAGVGSDPAQALARHDAYTALNAIEALVRTGPTGTNMLDLAIAVVNPVKHLAP